MDRRAFIAGSAGGMLAAAPPAAAAAGVQPRVPHHRIATYVANLRDYGGRRGVPATGAAVRLVRRPDRAFDPSSIAVVGEDGRHLGFLPGDHGQVLAPLIDAGLRFGGSVASATGGRAPRLEIDLQFLGMNDTT